MKVNPNSIQNSKSQPNFKGAPLVNLASYLDERVLLGKAIAVGNRRLAQCHRAKKPSEPKMEVKAKPYLHFVS